MCVHMRRQRSQPLDCMPSAAYSYATALKEICELEKFGSKLGLGRITRILKLLGNPQKRYKCILVGGSNGKGSTVEMIGSILLADGKKVGTYFSPQIEEFPERIRVDGKNAGRKEIADAYAEVKEVCSSNRIPATFFEVVTAMALLIFSRRKVDFAVLEVGLGGRLDATNAVEPEISAIASLSLEHTDVLGGTIAAIAHEKCGIARKGKKLVLGIANADAKAAVRKECKAKVAKAVFVEETVDEVHWMQLARGTAATPSRQNMRDPLTRLPLLPWENSRFQMRWLRLSLEVNWDAAGRRLRRGCQLSSRNTDSRSFRGAL